MRLLLASVALLSLGACASPPESAPTEIARPASSNILVVERIEPGVHVLRQYEPTFAGVVGNITLIEQSDGLVLVDSGNSHGAGVRIVEQVRAISPLPVKAVIITHWHNDHPLGLSAIIATWPDVDIIATQAAAASMEAGELGPIPRAPSAEYEETRRGLLQQSIDRIHQRAEDQGLSARERTEWALAERAAVERLADAAGTYLVLPRTTFTDRHLIADARRPVEALFLGRANTNGDAIIWLPRQRIVIAGDAVVQPIPYMFAMFPTEQIAVLDRIKALRPRILIPGHGYVQRDTRYLDQLQALIREVQRQVEPLAREGIAQDALAGRTDFSAQQALFAGDDPWLGYWFRQYALDPLIASVYTEATGGPLGQ